MKYQVIYLGSPETIPLVLSKPLSFEDANDLACSLQADIQAEEPKRIPIADLLKCGDFFVVEPIFGSR